MREEVSEGVDVIVCVWLLGVAPIHSTRGTGFTSAPICVCLCLCVCVCVCERERERERESVCVRL